MKRLLLWLSLWAASVFFAFTPNIVEAQCINNIQFPPQTITTLDQTITTPVTISTSSYTTDDYSAVQINFPGVYTFEVTRNSSGTPGYVTLTDDLNNVIAHGPSPFQVSIPITGQYRAHWTDNAACGGTSTGHTTTAVFSSSLGGCIPPQGITATGITTTSANISWTASTSNPANGYEYVITTSAGTPTGSGTATAATFFTANTLAPNTQYFVYVRAMCANDTSLWNSTSFLTACVTVTAPWSEDFEGAAFVPLNTFDQCWPTIPAIGIPYVYSWRLETGSTWSINTGPSADHTTGVGAGKYIYTEASHGSAGDTAEIWTPLIDISGITNPALRFWKHFYGADIDSFFVEVDTGSGFHTIYATQGDGPQTAETDPWIEEVLDLNAFAGSTALQIRFRAIHGGGWRGDLALDDISVDVKPPCPKPSAISVVSTGVADVTLDWVPGSGTSWKVAYGAPGFHPDSTVGSANGPIGIMPAGTHPFTVTGVTAGTDYHFYVREACATVPGANSEWRGPASARTYCIAVTVPWTEDFDGRTFAYNTFDFCWKTIPASDSGAYKWGVLTDNTGFSNTGPSADHTTGVPGAGQYIYTVGYLGLAGNQAEIWTPLINISGITNPTLRFWKHFYGTHIDSFFVEADTGSGFQTIYQTHGPGPQTAQTDPWVKEQVDLNSFAGSTALRIRFRAIRGGGWLGNLALDDIYVGACLNVHTAVINITTCGVSDGSISVSISGGTPPYSYLWNTGAITSSLSNLTAGTYQVTVSDNAGCTQSLSTSITQPSAALTATGGATDITCHGANDGSIDLTISGGVPGYTYAWDNGPTGTLNRAPYAISRGNLSEGTYQVSVSDANGCQQVSSYIITGPGLLVASMSSVTNVSCFGGHDGALTVSVSGGTSPYSYLWNTGAITSSLSNLTAGTYRVTVTDANACTQSISVNITQPGALVATGGATDITCHGADDGSIDVTVSGGTTPYTYAWSRDPQAGFIDPGTQDLSALEPGTYTLVVTDVNNCTQSLSVSITQPVALLTTGGSTNVTTCGFGNGSIALTVSGGAPGYTYAWDNGPTGTLNRAPYAISRGNLSEGTYQVSVSDADGCQQVSSYIITGPSLLTASISSIINVSCFGGNDGALTVSVSGGTPAYSYLWNTGAITSSLSNLTSGTYRVTVTDANACTQSLSVNITQPAAALTATASGGVTNVSCSGGSDGAIDVTVSGGTSPYSYSWNTGGTTSTLSNLTAGTYRVTVSDNAGCTQSLALSITEPRDLVVTGGTANISCQGAGDGSTSLTVSGGTTPYSYLWNTGGTTSTLNGLSAGTYRVTVSDNAGCTQSLALSITEPDALLVTGGATNISCQGANDGSTSLTVSGGTTPYNYLWNTGGTTSTLSNLAAGTYRVTISDNAGCTQSLVLSITEPDALVVTGGTTNISCQGAGDGSTSLTVSGGTIPYSYLWNTGGTTSTLSGLSAGTYRVTVSDNAGCTQSLALGITEPGDLVVTGGTTNISCYGASDGSTSLTVSGGTTPYSYLWNTGGTTSTLNGLSAGTYRVTVSDNAGCTESFALSITEPDALVVTGGTTNISCQGANDGSTSLTVSGGTTPYSYLWNTGGTTSTLSNLTAGTYRVTVSDNAGCTQSLALSITEPDALVVTHGVTSVSCSGGSDGSTSLTVSGGTPGYTYVWNNGLSAGTSHSNLSAGTYRVTVSDNAGCTQSLALSITEPDALVVTGGTADISCYGAGDGSTSLTVSGGTTPYSYLWNTGGTTSTLSNLAAGTYRVTVSDNAGCTESLVLSITEPDALVVTGGTTNISCQGAGDGSTTLTVSGGTPGYTYVWNNGLSAGASHNNLSAGTYRVTVSDNAGCTQSLALSITEPDALLVTGGTTSISCQGANDGSISLTVSGGTTPYSYLWNTGGTTSTLSGLSAGTYRVTVTDANACTQSLALSITEPDALIVTGGTMSISCQGAGDGSTSLTVSGGTTPYSYLWNTGGTTSTLSNLTAGTYRVTVTDYNGCTQSLSTNITQPAAALTATGGSSSITCHGANDGSIDVTVSGGTSPYSYSWNTGGTTSTLSGLSAGTYRVTVSDNAGCTQFLSTNITQPAAALAATGGSSSITCHGANDGSIDVTVSGGTTPYTYAWSRNPQAGFTDPGTEDLSGREPGIYTLNVTDDNGCSATLTFTLTEPEALTVSAGSVTNVSCFGGNDGAIALAVSDGTPDYSYLWNTGAITSGLSGLSAGTYRVTVTDANACTQSLSVSITQPGSIVSASSLRNITCHGANDGSIGVTVSGGATPYTYAWSRNPKDGFTDPGTGDLSGLQPGIYTLSFTDNNGCGTWFMFNLTEPEALTVLAGSVTNVSCFGGNDGAIALALSGGTSPYSYSWNTGGTTSALSNLTAGTYQVTVTDANACTQSLPVSITQPVALVATGGATDITCHGANDGSINVAVSGGTTPYTYTWNRNPEDGFTDLGTGRLSGLQPGTYTFNATDKNGCSATLTFVIAEPEALAVSAGSVTHASCSGNDGAIALAVSGGVPSYSYLWSTGGTTSSLSGLTVGTYRVTVTDANACTQSLSVNITQLGVALAATSGVTNVTCHGGSDGSINITVSGGTSPYSYLWNTGGTTSTLSNLTAGPYRVTVTDANGCTDSFSVYITQPDAALDATGRITNVTCHGDNDGSIDVTVSGGTPLYTYAWSSDHPELEVPEPGREDLSELQPGRYTLIVTDDNGCLATLVFYITQPSAALAATGGVTNVACHGGSDGSINTTVSGGTSPYSYLWNTGGTTSTLSNLTAGTYQVTVTDANACTQSLSVSITQPHTLVVSLDSASDVSSPGGRDGVLAVSVSGGTPLYSYLWNTGDSTPGLNNLKAGAYQITVTDANGCQQVFSYNITEPDQPPGLIVPDDNTHNDGTTSTTETDESLPYSNAWEMNGEYTDSAQVILVGVGMEGSDFARRINMYPNPATREVFIDYDFTSEVDLKVTVVNHLGQLVLTTLEPNAISGKLRLDVTDWANGIYNLLFSNGNQSNSRQLVIQK